VDPDEFNRVMDALDLPTVAAAAGLDFHPCRDGVYKSPFREDRKASFSVFGKLKRWRDHATGENGGTWKFAELAWPNMSKGEILHRLSDLAGVQLDTKPKGPRNISRHALRKSAKAKTAALLRSVNQPIEPLLHFEPWPDFIRDHYEEGRRPELIHDRLENLCERRKWDLGWVDFLCESGLLSFPFLPWIPRRFPAFVVLDPDGTPCGYHQRVWRPGSRGGPNWLYLPYRPKHYSEGNTFLTGMAAYASSRPAALVHPLPFIVGSPSAKLWIIHEGQWDAVSFAGCIGMFDDVFELDVAVFGLRGAGAGAEAMLRSYLEHLKTVRPIVWIWPDNDPAGQRLVTRADNSHSPQRMTFAEWIRKLTEMPVHVTRHPHKDFNAYLAASGQKRDAILAEMERITCNE
jgi:hypothetical protein